LPIKKISLALVLLSCLLFMGQNYDNPRTMIVRSKVANVRAKPVEPAKKYMLDPLQNTQLEEGETVYVFTVEKGWARVICPDQLVYSYRNRRWEGCPGWVKLDELTADLGRMKKWVKYDLPEEQLRKLVLVKAGQHLDTMYLWGGCSLYDPENGETLTGVDCSGLVNWAYRRIGMVTPRDANDQFMKARRVKRKELLPGDLVFLAGTRNRKEVRHVLIYTGGEEMIESPKTGERVRRITFQEKIGLPLAKLRNGMMVNDKVVYFGSFF
jgi:hypothetical protein